MFILFNHYLVFNLQPSYLLLQFLILLTNSCYIGLNLFLFIYEVLAFPFCIFCFLSVFLGEHILIFFLSFGVELFLQNAKFVFDLNFIFLQGAKFCVFWFFSLTIGLVITIALSNSTCHFVEFLGELTIGFVERSLLKFYGDTMLLVRHGNLNSSFILILYILFRSTKHNWFKHEYSWFQIKRWQKHGASDLLFSHCPSISPDRYGVLSIRLGEL